jgi:hypothetical protein
LIGLDPSNKHQILHDNQDGGKVMGGNNDFTRVSDQVCPSPVDESQLPAVSSPKSSDAPAPAGVSFQDNPAPQNENVCRPGDNSDNPVEAIKGLLDSLPKAPDLPTNANPKQVMEFQKKMNDYTSMMQTLSNVLRMLEQTSKSIMGNVR